MSRKKSFGKALAAGMAFSLVLTGCMGQGPQAVETDAQASLGTAVEVMQLKRSSIKNELTYIGQIEAKSQISVASQISAEVMEVYFDVGDTVQAGDVLFTVDAKDIQDQVRQLEMSAMLTEISVKQAQYALDLASGETAADQMNELQYLTAIYNARYGVQSSELAKDIYDDALDNAEADADDAWDIYKEAEAELNVLQAIGEGGMMDDGTTVVTPAMIAKQQTKVQTALNTYYAKKAAIPTAELQYDSSKITNRQSDKSLDLAYDSYDAYKEFTQEQKERSIRQAEFSVETALANQSSTQLQLEIAQSNLGKTQVKSPISGVISARSIEVGQLISQATLPYTIISMDTVNVNVSVSETLINSVSTGDEVQVVIQAIGGEPLAGVVTAVSPAAGSNSTYPVRVQLDNSDGMIKPGMFSQVSFVQDRKDQTFVVDKSVILTDETTSYVYIVEDGKAKKVTVTIGLTNGTEVEITSGVSLGDDIVVVGQEYVHDGDTLNVVKRDGESVRSAPPGDTDVVQASAEAEEADAA